MEKNHPAPDLIDLFLYEINYLLIHLRQSGQVGGQATKWFSPLDCVTDSGSLNLASLAVQLSQERCEALIILLYHRR